MPSRFATTVLILWVTLGSCAAVGQDRSDTASGSRWNVNWDRIDDGPPSRSLFDRADGPLNLGGWVSAGFTGNAHGNRTGNGNAPLPLNNVADSPVLNQFWIYAEKPLIFGSNTVDWGFRVDYLFGADGPDTQAGGDQGWDFDWNPSRDYGSAIPQLYLEAGTEDFAVLAGYFIGLQGFEASQAVDNFFYSHNYGFGYGVPGTHTGVLATYMLSDELEIDAGWSNGWDSSWSNFLDASMFIGGITWTPHEDISLTWHATAGDFGDGTARKGTQSNAGQLYAHAIIFTNEFSDRGTWVFENTFGNNTGIGNRNNRWSSITNHLYYTVNESWDAGLRVEWFGDMDGRRVDVNGSGPGSYYEATLGLNWQPHPNLRVRPEIRYDWFSGQGRPFDSRDGGLSGMANQQFTFGFDVVLMF
jgi:Putative beta-barrel porin-2, OmpL-like. bbp2